MVSCILLKKSVDCLLAKAPQTAFQPLPPSGRQPVVVARLPGRQHGLPKEKGTHCIIALRCCEIYVLKI